MMRSFALILGLGALTPALTSCTNLECGEGTFANGDTCVGFDPDDKTPPITTLSPPGGRSREPIPSLVTLTSDEPARIVYTTDGSDPDPAAVGEPSPVTVVEIEQGTTIKYLAIDRAGNQAAVGQATYDSDQAAPAPVTGLTVTISGTTPSVTWTNPTDGDFAGTVLARVSDAIDANPTPGEMVPVAAALSASVAVVSVGAIAAHQDAGRPAGPVRYVAWTFDDLGNYSAPVAASADIPLGSTSAQFTFDATAQALTLVTSPADFDVSGTTAALVGTTLTVSLSVKNNSTRYLQNPKAEVTAVASATFASSDGTADGFPFESLGPNMLAPGATATADLVFTGVAAGTTPTIDLALAHHASMLTTAGRSGQRQGLLDLGSGLMTPPLVMMTSGPNDRKNGKTRPGQLVGGRYLDVPTTHGAIERWDLVTRTKIGGLDLNTGDRLVIQALIPAGSERFALIKQGGHRRSAPMELIRIDESFTITGRLTLPRPEERGITQPVLSPDGTMLAIALSGGVLLVDTRTMTAIDANPATAVLELIDPGFVDVIRGVAFFPDGSGFVVLARQNGRAAIIHRDDSSYTVTPWQDATTTAKGYSIATGPDGRVWMALSSGIRAYDPVADAVSTVSYAAASHGLSVLDGRVWIIRSDRFTLDQVSVTGAVERTLSLTSLTNGAYGHWLHVAR